MVKAEKRQALRPRQEDRFSWKIPQGGKKSVKGMPHLHLHMHEHACIGVSWAACEQETHVTGTCAGSCMCECDLTTLDCQSRVFFYHSISSCRSSRCRSGLRISLNWFAYPSLLCADCLLWPCATAVKSTGAEFFFFFLTLWASLKPQLMFLTKSKTIVLKRSKSF